LRSMNLRRRRRLNQTSIRHVNSLIQKELRSSGSTFGYGIMWKRMLQKYKVTVPRDVVMRTLSQLDPVGSHERRGKKFYRRKYRSKV
jgi:hypothetical protein